MSQSVGGFLQVAGVEGHRGHANAGQQVSASNAVWPRGDLGAIYAYNPRLKFYTLLIPSLYHQHGPSTE